MLLDGKQVKNGSITNAKLATPSGNAVNTNKEMTAAVTVADFDNACATAIASTPASGSYVQVSVNGQLQDVGDGVRTNSCYFSSVASAGAVARAISAIVATDKLYWVQSVAGFNLAATDKISFFYDA